MRFLKKSVKVEGLQEEHYKEPARPDVSRSRCSATGLRLLPRRSGVAWACAVVAPLGLGAALLGFRLATVPKQLAGSPLGRPTPNCGSIDRGFITVFSV
jgi:hypothetical protein